MAISALSTRLLTEQNECTLSWSTRDGSPAATIVSFVWAKEALWMTALAGCSRVNAIRRNNKVAIVISGKGTDVGISRCLSLRGHCEIYQSQQQRDWFFPLFAEKVLPLNSKSAKRMAEMMNSPENLVLKMTPEQWHPYDSHTAMLAAGGA
mgnify:CR=1 FL=1